MVLGCIIPEYGFIPADDNIMEYLQRAAVRVCPKLLITDMVSEASHFLQEIGVPVLYIDSGQFPAEVYPAEIPGNTFFNANCFFSPYRSGWDQGNAVALIEKNSVFDMPPTEGFADLRFYSMIQGTNPIQVSNAIKIFELTDTQIPFKLIQKIKAVESDNKADTVYVEKLHRKTAKLCAYYMEGQYKQTHAAVTSLHFFLGSVRPVHAEQNYKKTA